MKDFATARTMIGGLKGVMAKLGDAPPHDHKWKVFPKCPFCGEKDCAGVFNKGGVDYFKCHHTSCNSGNAVLTEVPYIAMRKGLSQTAPAEGGASPAYEFFLKLAGCWEDSLREGRQGGTLREGHRGDKDKAARPAQKAPSPAPAASSEPVGLNPVIPSEVEIPAPPVSGQSPHPGPLPVERGEGEKNVGNEPKDDENMILAAIEVLRQDQRASISLLQRRLKLGFKRAARIMDELGRRGIVGPEQGSEPREILKLPDLPPGKIKVNIDGEMSVLSVGVPPAPAGGAAAAEVTPAKEGEKSSAKAEPKSDPKAEEKAKLPLGLASLREFFSKLSPTESQMTPYLESGTVPDPLPQAVAKRLKYKPVSLFEKRGLTSQTCEALGFRANPVSNEALLQDLKERHSWEELRAAGLWLESSRKAKLGRRPNAQFHGKGQLGKKPEKERKGKDDKWVWGFCEPVLIPFFDEAGDLMKLRPHKGGAPAGTVAGRPRIYVPRDYRNCADVVEKFYEVVICEGEFKAAAIWQTLGLGAQLQSLRDGHSLREGHHGGTLREGHHGDEPSPPLAGQFEPIGVCALPGISYVTNVEMRMDLERWLLEVGARRVIVAFDDEDKSDKPLRQRFDAQRDARVLAIELSQLLHVEARVCVLPRAWRNPRGKADWDGALVKLVTAVTA